MTTVNRYRLWDRMYSNWLAEDHMISAKVTILHYWLAWELVHILTIYGPHSNWQYEVIPTHLHKGGMKLGIVPLWSAWKDLSNDVLKVGFNVSHIFCNPYFFSWFWVKIQLTTKWTSFECSIKFMLITMVQVPASYLIYSQATHSMQLKSLV